MYSSEIQKPGKIRTSLIYMTLTKNFLNLDESRLSLNESMTEEDIAQYR